MSHSLPSVRVPLRLPTAVATFGIGIAGYLGVNLSPYMISALQSALGADVLTASWIVTGALLLTAIAGLATAKLSAGRRRRLVARVGLVLAVVGFGAAALVPTGWVVVAGLLVGGLGAGGAVSSSGAALAAFINPDRVAGISGLANRAVVTVILAVVPLVGLAPINVFGTLAVFALAVLFTSAWLPSAPAVDHAAAPAPTDDATAEASGVATSDAGAAGLVTRRPHRAETIAGFVLLVTFALWAVSEDSLWAMAGVMGADQSGLTPEGLGLALSGATAGGIVGALLLMIVGNRLGRAVPLAVLLVAGGLLKIAEGFVTDSTAFIVVFIAWNTVYAIAFLYFVATAAALDADGRWSGPLLAVYLVGSSLTPVIGAALVEAFGYQGFTVVLGIASFVLAVPAFLVARVSSRLQRIEHVAPAVAEEVAA
ncbi:MFS family permease [Agromyces sp. 3263]|uniref:MFS transporter n=1 Tax=Agromyces sp. 3263 TaxID=2817750 RepID=UPI0028552AEB|nr:MFS transporter [Agromyces sp. 3263]MDR6905324.1 MFS family permease [Agromyces sp. 3263]